MIFCVCSLYVWIYFYLSSFSILGWILTEPCIFRSSRFWSILFNLLFSKDYVRLYHRAIWVTRCNIVLDWGNCWTILHCEDWDEKLVQHLCNFGFVNRFNFTLVIKCCNISGFYLVLWILGERFGSYLIFDAFLSYIRFFPFLL